MSNCIKIHERVSGSVLQHEEWWFLVSTSDGKRYVMVERHSIDPGSKEPAKTVKKSMTIEEVLSQGDELAAVLRAALETEPQRDHLGKAAGTPGRQGRA